MRSGTEVAREIQLTDWSTTGNLSNRSPGVQIPRDICTRFGRYFVLYEVQLDNKSLYKGRAQFRRDNYKATKRKSNATRRVALDFRICFLPL